MFLVVLDYLGKTLPCLYLTSLLVAHLVDTLNPNITNAATVTKEKFNNGLMHSEIA